MLTIAGRVFRSRLFGGTGKFSSPRVMKEALDASGCEMVTVALRRVDLANPEDDIMSVLDRKKFLFLPNTSGARDAQEAVRLARLAGAIILPPMVAYYPRPTTVDDITDFFAGKVLDLLGVQHELYRRWGE